MFFHTALNQRGGGVKTQDTHHHRVRVPNRRILNRGRRLSSSGGPRPPAAATGSAATATYTAAIAAVAAADTIISGLEAHVLAGELGDHREEELHRRAGVRGAVCVCMRACRRFCFCLSVEERERETEPSKENVTQRGGEKMNKKKGWGYV